MALTVQGAACSDARAAVDHVTGNALFDSCPVAEVELTRYLYQMCHCAKLNAFRDSLSKLCARVVSDLIVLNIFLTGHDPRPMLVLRTRRKKVTNSKVEGFLLVKKLLDVLKP